MTHRQTLHFLTCGHVDDGKSTLIGRLLYDIGAVPDDQVQGAMVDGKVDYSRLTDGLEDERAQGITIDVAYRFFRYGGRHYRIADTPGHVQYVRNMAVAAANSDCALILVDATHGVREQTLRHSKIALFFGIRHFIIAVNKMDLAGYDESRFNKIQESYRDGLGEIPDVTLTFIPVSAINGDNLSASSMNMPWYRGPNLLEYLAEVEVPAPPTSSVRLPVQSTIRLEEKRGYHGVLGGGNLQAGDVLHVADTSMPITISEIYHGGRATARALPGQAITVVPAEEVDLSRGNVLYGASAPVRYADAFTAALLWLDPAFAQLETVPAIIKIHHCEEQAEAQIKVLRDPIAEAQIFTASPIPMDAYSTHRATGLFLLIQPETEKVIAVGTVQSLQGKEWNFSI